MSDTTTDQRVCVTCEHPIQKWGTSVLIWVHLTPPADSHEAVVKLAHPMDLDPFAGLDDDYDA